MKENTKKCPHCKKDIDSEATKCPFCRSTLISFPSLINRHPLIVLFLILVIIGIYFFSKNSNNPSIQSVFTSTKATTSQSTLKTTTNNSSQDSVSNSIENFDSKITTQYILDLLQTISMYDLAENETQGSGDEVTAFMTQLMNENNLIKVGEVSIEKYINSSNDVIALSAKGTYLGGEMWLKANNDMLTFLKTADLNSQSFVQQSQYQFATYQSSQREAGLTIFRSAPMIGYLIFRPATVKNSTGLIPYNLSRDQRDEILKSINKLFSKSIQSYNNDNSSTKDILIAVVVAIENYISPDTYEESNSLLK